MRKKLLCTGLAMVMAISMTACGGSEQQTTPNTTQASTETPKEDIESTTESPLEVTEENIEETTEAISDESLENLGDIFEYLGTISTDLAYTISPAAKDFINQTPFLFPCEDKETAMEYTDSSISFKMVNKNQNKYGDSLMFIEEAYVVGINETNYKDGSSLTELQAMDADGNYYYILYIGILNDIYQEDIIQIYGAPLGMTSFANVSGGTTISCVLAGSYIEKTQ